MFSQLLKIKIINKFFTGNVRTVKVKKNIAFSFVLRTIQIFTGFLIVPLALNYLDTTRYGIWLALSSVIGWFGLSDLGLGYGLRNKLSESLAKDNYQLARNYVSTAYFSLLIIAGFAFLLFFLINHYLNWSSILNTKDVSNNELSLLAIYAFGFFF